MHALLFFIAGYFFFAADSFLSNKLILNQKSTRFCQTSSNIEGKLLTLINEVDGRGAKANPEQSASIRQFIETLENVGGIKSPISSPYLEGCWKLLYTSSPGTNSPIQRTFTSFNGVSIYQIINLINTENSFLPNNSPDVSNVVCFGTSSRLRVTALASTKLRPLVVPREGDGKILGLNIFGISSSQPPRDPLERIDFAFQDACFEFASFPSFTIPYPVPFKLLGDEAKGWIDITYLSNNIRIVRGNKGTIFVLQKSDTTSDDIASWASKQIKRTSSRINRNTDQNNQIIESNIINNNVKILNVKKSISTASSSSSSSTTSSSSSSISTQSSSDIFKNIFTTFPQLNFINQKNPSELSKLSEESITLIFPCQLGEVSDYMELQEELRKLGIKSVVTPLTRFDWPIGLLPSFFSSEYWSGDLKPSKTLKFYFEKVDEAIEKILRDNNTTSNGNIKINLLCHSIGGWVARAWLSEWCSPDIRNRVQSVVTLGSPHLAPPDNTAAAKIDQTRGLLKYISSNYPGAFEKKVSYSSVIGTGVTGSVKGGKDWYTWLAYLSYTALSGTGDGVGDGIIPVTSASLPGATILPINDIYHANFIPFLPNRSIPLPLQWYGSEDIVKQWYYLLK